MPAPTALPVAPPADPDSGRFPGGADRPAYKVAFNAWALFFLLVICAGLLNYLGTYLKTVWPGI